MLNIVKHIQQLLPQHDCVIVPGLGGFVVQETTTAVDPQTHCFTPAHKEVVFNETLQYNDGLLIESYRKANNVDYPTARQMVQTDVITLKASLQTDRSLLFGEVGTFTLGDEGQLIFHAEESAWLNASYYGLTAFTFEPLAAIAPTAADPQATDRSKEVYYLPISRTFIRIVSAAVVALAFFLGFSQPVEELDRTAYTAGFIPTEMMASTLWDSHPSVSTSTLSEVSTTEETPTTPVTEPVATESSTKSSSNSATTTTSSPKVTAPTATTTAVTAPATTKAQATTNGKKYYAVVGSFPSQSQADKFISEADKTHCPQMNILFRNEKYRVYAACFDSREKAESYIEKLKGHSPFKDTWLFITR